MKKIKINDKKIVNETCYICKGFTASGKPIWRKDEIEKAHQDGEMHPNGKWVWVSSANGGKGDWRSAKRSSKKTEASAGGSSAGSASKTETKQVAQQTHQEQAAQQAQPGAQKEQAGQQTQKTQPNKKIEDMTPDELIDYAKNASTDALSNVVNDNKADKQFRQLAFNELKTRKDYDKTKVSSSDLDGGYISKPKPTIQYKNKKPEVEIPEPEDFMTPSKTGELKPQRISTIRKLYAKRTDDELLNTLNNRNAKWQLRQLAYDEAAARGIPEDKINVKGTLQLHWKKEKDKKEMEDEMNKEFNEDEAIELSYDWKGLDHKKILDEEFDGGLDTAWLDPNSDRVKKVFRTETLSGRQKYDTFKDYYQRDPKLVPGYLNAKNKVNNLYGQMLNWAKADNSPMFISAGGAGAGKTFGWQEIAKYLSLPELKPGNNNATNQDWGYVMLTDKAAEDPNEFNKTLAKYNGTWIDDHGNERPHILFFDDADKLLISKSPALMAILKKINDNNPENRIFHNPETGEDEIWKGKIIVTTNKDIGALSKSEDFKAIQSRVTVNEIKFTRNETMEILADRYMKMKLPDECTQAFKEDNYTEDEIEDFRQDMFDFMQEHIQDADPNKFTPRAFLKLCQDVAPVWKSGSKVINTGTIKAGTDLHWRKTALEILKAEENDIEKSEQEDSLYSKDAMLETKRELERTMAEAKKNGSYEKLFGTKAQDLILFGEADDDEDDDEKDSKKKNKKEFSEQEDEDEQEEENKVQKSFDDEMSLDEALKSFDDEMSLDEAESILLS